MLAQRPIIVGGAQAGKCHVVHLDMTAMGERSISGNQVNR